MSGEEALGFLRPVLARIAADGPLHPGDHAAVVLDDAVVIAYVEDNELQLRVILGKPAHLPIATGFRGERGSSFWAWVDGGDAVEEDEDMPGLDEDPPGEGTEAPDVLEIAKGGAEDAARRAGEIMRAMRAMGTVGASPEVADLAQTVLGLARTVIGLCGVVRELRDRQDGGPRPQ